MFLAFLFLASCAYAGFSAAKKLELFDSQLKRVALGFLAAFAVETMVLLAVSWLSGGLSIELVLLVPAAFGLLAFHFNKHLKTPRTAVAAVTRADKIAIAFALLFLLLNLVAVLAPTRTGVESVISVWGDYPLHLGIANSFVLRDNFPPDYPVLVGEPLKYSFAMDFASAVLLKGGLDVRWAFVVPNVLVFLALALGMVLLAELFAGKRKTFAFVFFALALFFLNGNYGVAAALEDASAQNSLSPLLHPARNYSNVDEKGIVLMNWIYSILLPARSALLGLAVSVLIYCLLYSSVLNARWRKEELLAAGVLAGLLPLLHAHSLVAVSFVSGVLFLLSWRKREWAFFLAPAVLLSLPQVAWLSGKVFLKPLAGWMAPEKTILGIAEFWLKNGWGVLLGFVAWALFAMKAREKARLSFALPFALIFVAANAVVFQPWDWDNTKLFVHFFLFASIAAALFLDSLLRHAGALPKAVACAIVLVSVASGVLAVVWTGWGGNARFEVFSNHDFALADWIKENTPQDALFLSSLFHQNPVPALAGRSIVAGYDGWLWSHGLDYWKKTEDAKRMFEEGDCFLIKDYGVDFVLVRGQWEDPLPFENENFVLVYEDSRKNKVFKSICSA